MPVGSNSARLFEWMHAIELAGRREWFFPAPTKPPPPGCRSRQHARRTRPAGRAAESLFDRPARACAPQWDRGWRPAVGAARGLGAGRRWPNGQSENAGVTNTSPRARRSPDAAQSPADRVGAPPSDGARGVTDIDARPWWKASPRPLGGDARDDAQQWSRHRRYLRLLFSSTSGFIATGRVWRPASSSWCRTRSTESPRAAEPSNGWTTATTFITRTFGRWTWSAAVRSRLKRSLPMTVLGRNDAGGEAATAADRRDLHRRVASDQPARTQQVEGPLRRNPNMVILVGPFCLAAPIPGNSCSSLICSSATTSDPAEDRRIHRRADRVLAGMNTAGWATLATMPAATCRCRRMGPTSCVDLHGSADAHRRPVRVGD